MPLFESERNNQRFCDALCNLLEALTKLVNKTLAEE